MDDHGLPYSANLSLLFTELPLLDRPAAAAGAGFTAVEFWWPFTEAVPPAAKVDRFIHAIKVSGVALTGLNLYAGDMEAGDRGLVSWVGREAEFAESLAVAVRIAKRLGCRSLNALYGNRIENVDPAEQDKLALANLDLAAEEAWRADAQILIEPLSGADHYPLRTAAHVTEIIDEIGRDNIRLLADLYHLAVNRDDLGAAVTDPRVGHLQIADAPGRHQPGTGSLDLGGYLGKAEAAGYRGYVGIEYKPLGGTVASLGWLPFERRGRE
ncbi:hydroxypyruvate isomerase [Amycolatopsis xylanica]|uniref:Hydroxypyruvate isomerase n=1 Tax=Amycolatopsis xylanica TaxID=589385 RepID=A0A1H2T8F0_9PSEU|nr:TIM barrel protein [Amycolatopsis xylanica]SDW39985.1 hydroxypyruvate isomerase [Amycolatopsis xylanica]